MKLLRTQARAPRLVLRFAILASLALGLAAAGILPVVRHVYRTQLEDQAAARAAILSGGVLALLSSNGNPSDPAVRARLDGFVEARLTPTGIVDLVVYDQTGRPLYASGTRGERLDRPTLSRVKSGTVVTQQRIIEQRGAETQVLETLTPLPLGRNVGAVRVAQDYAPIAQDLRTVLVAVAGVLEIALILLFILLVPSLGRASRRIDTQMAELERAANEDDLTGLPNRRRFVQELGAIGTSGERRKTLVVVADIDRFRDVNETLGHEAGDRLLAHVGDRLESAIPADWKLGRLGADEFALGVPGMGPAAIGEVRSTVDEALRQPLIYDGVPLGAEVSLGAAVAPDDGVEPEVLLRRAGIALAAAKMRRSGVEIYDSSLDGTDPSAVPLLAGLRTALERHELVLRFQPLVDLRTNAIIGAEALVRWLHPDRGLIPPGEFLPLVERTGLLRPVSRYVLREAIMAAHRLDDAGLPIPISVNLTMFDLLDPDLPREVERLLGENGLSGERLRVELTESAVMADTDRTRATLLGLRDLGVTVAIDDFGTGFSSLATLRSLPVDVLKIDRVFVGGMCSNPDDAAIVRSTIGLAHSLGLSVVAEGVETEETRRELGSAGCDVIQGFLTGRPATLSDLVSAWRHTPVPTAA